MKQANCWKRPRFTQRRPQLLVMVVTSDSLLSARLCSVTDSVSLLSMTQPPPLLDPLPLAHTCSISNTWSKGHWNGRGNWDPGMRPVNTKQERFLC